MVTQRCLKTSVVSERAAVGSGTALHKMLPLQQLSPPNPSYPGSGHLPLGLRDQGSRGVGRLGIAAETAVASMGLANTQLMRPAVSLPREKLVPRACVSANSLAFSCPSIIHKHCTCCHWPVSWEPSLSGLHWYTPGMREELIEDVHRGRNSHTRAI